MPRALPKGEKTKAEGTPVKEVAMATPSLLAAFRSRSIRPARRSCTTFVSSALLLVVEDFVIFRVAHGQQIELGRHLGAANNGHQWPQWLVQHSVQRRELRLHGATGGRRQQACQGFRRGMRSMCHREGVVDVDITEPCERFCEARIIRLLSSPTSPTCPPQVAHFSNGCKARSCRGSKPEVFLVA
jgi:hypothetical protein